MEKRPYFDTLCRPLTLAFICVLFEKNNNDIPFKGTEIYLQIVELLVDKWERDNRIVRHSKYLGFLKERKIRFLAEFSYSLSSHNGEKEFSKENLKSYLKPLLKKFNIPPDELNYLVEEIENHTGLFLEIGNKYCFSHFSIQEFLAAYHLFNIGSIPNNQEMLTAMPEILAICVALSSDSTLYFIELYLHFLTRYTKLHKEKIITFLERVATESPEFQESEFLGIYLISLYAGVVLKKDNFNKNLDDRFAERIKDADTQDIDTIYQKLLKNTTIKKSFTEGLTFYDYGYDLVEDLILFYLKPYLKHSGKYPFPSFLVLKRSLLDIKE